MSSHTSRLANLGILAVIVSIIGVGVLATVQVVGAQQPGFSLTIEVTSHPFGYEHVYVWVLGANGFSENKVVSTAGGASWTFNIPPDQGNFVKACAAGSFVSSILNGNCVYVQNTGQDKIVRLRAP